MRHLSFWARSLALTTTAGVCLSAPVTLATPSNSLTPAQVKTLKAVGVKIALPNYVPKDFQVAQVTTIPCKTKRDAQGVCQGKAGYTVLYRNASKTCFTVYGEYTRGIGGGAGQFAFPVVVPLLGETVIGFGNGRSIDDQPATAQQLQVPQPNLLSFPVYQPKTAIIYGIRMEENRLGCGANRSITPTELGKILQSLAWL
jgi:hypothetical protein